MSKTDSTDAADRGSEWNAELGLAPERDIVGRLRHVVPEHGWAVVNTETDGIVIWFSERREFHTERKARAWLQEHAETHRTHEVRPYADRCLEHEAADEIERLRDTLAYAEAALADIGDADREPGDDLAWCEARAAEALPRVRACLRA